MRVCHNVNIVVELRGVDDWETHGAAAIVALDEVIFVEKLFTLVTIVEIGNVKLIRLEPAETLEI